MLVKVAPGDSPVANNLNNSSLEVNVTSFD